MSKDKPPLGPLGPAEISPIDTHEKQTILADYSYVYPSAPSSPPPAKEKIPLPKPSAIKKYLDKFVIGQEEAKKAIAVALVNHLYCIDYNSRQTDATKKLRKHNLLLLGDSGVGKTYIVKVAAEYLNIPLTIEDATRYSSTGYVGDDVQDMLTNLYMKAEYNVDLTEMGIIFIDEFDKLGCVPGGGRPGGPEVNTLQVQQGLLKLIEGTEMRCRAGLSKQAPDIVVDTHDILFILAGSFDGIVGKKKKAFQEKTGRVGFILTPEVEVAERGVSEEDLLKFGIIPEILGRIGNFVQLESLTRDDYLNILKTSENSPLKQFKKLFELRGKKFPLTNKELESIVDEAQKSKLGVRGLSRVLEKRLLDKMYD